MESLMALNGHLQIEIWLADFQHAVSGHPEVTIEKIRQTLKKPSRVIQSKNSDQVCLFYSLKVETEDSQILYFCVVIAVVMSGKGKLVTAYETDFIKTGTLLFSKD
jgi:hypothetical protein